VKSYGNRRGAALVAALVTLLVVTLIAGTIVQSLMVAHRQTRRQHDELQAQWLAEAAAERAAAQLARQADYAGEMWQPAIDGAGPPDNVGVAAIRVEKVASQPGQFRVVVEARYPNHEWRQIAVHRQYKITSPSPMTQPPAAESIP
jgi:Tfp pilus assembly protein PilX